MGEDESEILSIDEPIDEPRMLNERSTIVDKEDAMKKLQRHDQDESEDLIPDDPLLMNEESTIIDNEHAMKKKLKHDQKREKMQFGQVLGDQTAAQSLVLEDIVDDMDGYHDTKQQPGGYIIRL